MKPRNSTNKRALDAEAKAVRAYELRCHGKTYQEIAEELGFSSAGGAHDAFSRGRAMLTREKTDEARDMMVDRLSMLRAAAMPAAMQGNLPAIETVLKIDKREAELLGIEAQPVQVGITYDAKASLKAKIDQYMRRTGMIQEPEDVSAKSQN